MSWRMRTWLEGLVGFIDGQRCYKTGWGISYGTWTEYPRSVVLAVVGYDNIYGNIKDLGLNAISYVTKSRSHT
jgi:hypothetical protein